MTPTRQNAPNTPVFTSQLAYLAVERPPADETEAQRLGQLRQLIQAAPDVADLRDFATPARELMGEGYTIHCGSSHVWLKRDNHAGRLAIIADRYTTRYRDWDAPAPPQSWRAPSPSTTYKKWFFGGNIAPAKSLPHVQLPEPP